VSNTPHWDNPSQKRSSDSGWKPPYSYGRQRPDRMFLLVEVLHEDVETGVVVAICQDVARPAVETAVAVAEEIDLP
jgi:hypothetical protein